MLFFFYDMVKAISGNARAPLTWSLSLRQACMSNSSTTRAVSESHRRHGRISQLKGNPSCATPPGLEPGIPWFVVRRLIHWATGPLSRVGNAPSPTADFNDFKIHYGEALIRQKCERLLPVTSLVVVQASFPAVGRLSGTANTPSWGSVHYVSKLHCIFIESLLVKMHRWHKKVHFTMFS